MIQTWTIQNFKSVSDKTTLHMKPLTLFAGPNSSGKSTLIQSILLVAQTLQTTVNSRSVVLNGHMLRLGSFDEIVFNHQKDQRVCIGFGLTPITGEDADPKIESLGRERGKTDIIECDFIFSSEDSDEKKENWQLQPVLEESNIRVHSDIENEASKTIFSARKNHGNINKKLEKFGLKENRLQKEEINSLCYDIIKPEATYPLSGGICAGSGKTFHTYEQEDIGGASFSHFLPKTLTEIWCGTDGELSDSDFPEIKSIYKEEFSLMFGRLPESVYFAVENIRRYFAEHLKYLGPLREEPKPVYPLADKMDSRDVGIRGEHTASVLNIHSNTSIEYVPSDQFARNEPNPCSKHSTLSDAVLDWLDYMGVVSDVKTLNLGNIGVELKVALDNEFWHNLVHVGIGVSQVLPIVVSALLAEKGTTLIFEQPELHLHPRVQTRLADFFLSMAILKKQCIVETHSEYLVNRLCYRSAIAEGDQVSDEVAIFFVEREDGRSIYREIKINKFGVIRDWPKGFFDENEENATKILKAVMEKRKRESGKRRNA